MSSYLIPADFTYLPSFPFYLVTTGLNATNLPLNHYGLSLAFWSHSTEKLQEPSKTLKKSFVWLKKANVELPFHTQHTNQFLEANTYRPPHFPSS